MRPYSVHYPNFSDDFTQLASMVNRECYILSCLELFKSFSIVNNFPLMSVSWVLLALLMFMSCRITKSRTSQRVQRGLELLAVYYGPEFSQTLAPVPEVPVNT